MSTDTIFGKILRGEIPCDKVYETSEVLAFRDINPAAPNHVLVIPKRRIQNAGFAEENDKELLGAMILAAQEVAKAEGIFETGYRLVFNVGPDAAESVPHLHLHVIGGRSLGWPPG